MGILGTIFGSSEVISKGIDLIDSFHTSTEEEIAANAAAKVRIMQSYEPFKIAQRYIALLFTFTFLGCFILILGMTLLGDVDVEGARSVISEFWIGQIMLMIATFYFGGGLAESIKAK
jgi:hypothetical protein